MAIKIVPVEDIPTKMVDIPTNLMEVYETCQRMNVICDIHNGIGLSAVQVGIPWKLFVVNESFEPYHNREKYEIYIDCEYEGLDEKTPSMEACLSLKDDHGKSRYFQVERYSQIKVTGKKLVEDGENLELQEIDQIFNSEKDKDGIYCIVLQHEIDHHKGILISDIGKEIHIMR